MAVAALAPAGLLVHPWATPAAYATGIHHPVNRAAEGMPSGETSGALPGAIPAITLSQAQQQLPFHIVTPGKTTLPGSFTFFAHVHGTGSKKFVTLTDTSSGRKRHTRELRAV